MILNRAQNTFLFRFPVNFIPDEIKEKYQPFLTRNLTVYQDTIEFLNSTIHKISWPEINLGSLPTQVVRGEERKYKPGYELERYFVKEFEVSLRAVDDYSNYFIMQDILEHYLRYGEKEQDNVFVPNMHLFILNNYGDVLMKFEFQNVVFSGLTGLDLSFVLDVKFNSFDAKFHYTHLNIIKTF